MVSPKNKKKDFEDYIRIATIRGFEWLGNMPANTHTVTEWKCAAGHIWKSTYHNISQGNNCPHCSNRIPKTAIDFHELAAKRSFMWVGESSVNTQVKTTWQCKKGHRWEAKYTDIFKGRGCPYCSNRIPKTPTDYHNLAATRGFTWIGNHQVSRNNMVTQWQCSLGHIWETTYASIQQGTGCPFCAGNAPKTLEDYYELARARNIEWLGEQLPKNTTQKTFWRCSEGHIWETSYSVISVGHGCRVCRDIYANVRQRHPDDAYIALAKSKGFTWLGGEVLNTRSKTRWQCSQGHIWISTYGNVQKAKDCPKCANLASSLRQRFTSAEYQKLAHELGFEWIGSEVPRNGKHKTKWRCPKGHEWETSFDSLRSGNGCHYCSGRAAKKPEDYHLVAIERGISWIGDKLPHNVDTRTLWRCSKGHEWEAVFYNIKLGTGCPKCAAKSRNNWKRITSQHFHEVAEKNGFEWIGVEAEGNNAKTKWRCSKGHEWEAAYASIHQGHGCPYCARNHPLAVEDYLNIGKNRDILWTGTELPKNNQTKTKWRCSKGHEWESIYNSVKDSLGCPFCLGFVNGQPVSKPQRKICEMVNGELNIKFKRYNIDIVIYKDNFPIAIEYDCWYWHKNKLDHDAKKTTDMIMAGWRVLRIKASMLIPSQQQLDDAIHELISGSKYAEIVLDDWG